MVVSRIRLVAGAEIEYFAAPTLVAAAATEDFAALEPAYEDQHVRCGNIKWLAVHLLLGDFDIISDAFHNRMSWFAHPQPFGLSGLAPFQIAGSAHHSLEKFRFMARMQHEQTHPIQYILLYAIHHMILDFIVQHVAPPRQDIGLAQHVIGQAMLWLVESCRAHGTAIVS